MSQTKSGETSVTTPKAGGGSGMQPPSTRKVQLPPAVAKVPGSAGSIESMLRAEWVLANGLGGFAMGSAAGVPTRRYHGWLIGATRPPVGRILAWSGCAETLVLLPGASGGTEQTIDLSTFRFSSHAGGVLAPKGHEHLKRFERDPCGTVRWEYAFGPVRVVRELTLLHGANAAVVKWRIRAGGHAARLEVRPLTALRDFHGPLTHNSEGDQFKLAPAERGAELSRGGLTLGLRASSGAFKPQPQWWYNFEYVRDAERGQDCHEDLFSPGVFEITLPSLLMVSGTDVEHTAEISAWLAADEGLGIGKGGRTFTTFAAATKANTDRLAQLVGQAQSPFGDTSGEPELAHLAALTCAADQFVVRRESQSSAKAAAGFTSVIAGYPWFSDWGRDTMISLPGLLLATRRFAEAKSVLETFAAMAKGGLVPNCFSDQTGEAEFNTADGSLWFLHAACEYLAQSGDRAGFEATIKPACLAIVDAYIKGTDWQIKVDSDGLVAAGNEGTQLTWMDAKRDGVVFTPRHGKPVELSALWYSGLMELAAALGPKDAKKAAELRAQAAKTGESFRAKFWDATRHCLFDTLYPAGPGKESPAADLRPNQLFAVSQPFSPLAMDQQKAVVAYARQHLLTPLGLRSLDPRDSRYCPRFRGTLFDRDKAYHNGTVWPWLLGAYCRALANTGGTRDEIRSALSPLIECMSKGHAVGTIPEIFDGEGTDREPRRPDGCMAQAWSVAEVLRSYAATLGR